MNLKIIIQSALCRECQLLGSIANTTLKVHKNNPSDVFRCLIIICVSHHNSRKPSRSTTKVSRRSEGNKYRWKNLMKTFNCIILNGLCSLKLDDSYCGQKAEKLKLDALFTRDAIRIKILWFFAYFSVCSFSLSKYATNILIQILCCMHTAWKFPQKFPWLERKTIKLWFGQ